MKLFLQKLLFIVFFIFCFSVPENSFGQQPLTRKISFLEGLSSDVVYDLFVDKEGLLYLGTDKGLMTYDGVHFGQLSIPQSLGNSMNSIQQDETGKIWCKNFANQLFYLEKDQLIVDKNIKILLEKTDANLIDFSLGTNSIYILTQKVLYSYVSGKIKRVFEIKSNDAEGFNSIVYDKKGQKLYVASTNSLFVFKNNVLIEKKRHSGEQKILEIFKDDLAYCTKSLNKNCVIGTRSVFLKESNLENTYLNRFSATNDNLWLCTNKGIYEYDERNGTFKNGFLKDIRITDIVQDFEGNQWISSLDEGLFMLPNRKIFELEMASNKKRSYTCISKGPNDNYFVGANDGHIIEINSSGKNIREYETSWDNTIEFINFVGDTVLTNYGFFRIGPAKVMANNVYFGKNLKKDNKGNLLMAAPSFGGLISRKIKGKPNFNNKKNKFKIIEYGENKLQTLIFRNKRTKSILYDPLQQEYYY
jgi:ligand-binding sensor domain-containing protein